MNTHLLAAAEFHTTFLNTLQTAILYDLCIIADEDGEARPNWISMAKRWRIKESHLRSMLKELQHADLITYTGQRAIIKDKILKCPDGCKCPFAEPVKKVVDPEGTIIIDETLGISDEIIEAIDKLHPDEKPKWTPEAPPNPGSLSGIWDKLDEIWKTRWGTKPVRGHIQKALGPIIKEAFENAPANLPLIERAFANYLKNAKDSEAGKISMIGFAGTWGVWVNPKGQNTVQSDAKVFLGDALGVEL